MATILYGAGGKVYITARDGTKAANVMKKIKAFAAKDSGVGELRSLDLLLDDLTTVIPAAEAFLDKETKLHGLWLNAGVSLPPYGSKSSKAAT